MKKGSFFKFKTSTGITLIALVITIVVMLILAGVTINLTLGENGIFTTAQQAAQNYTEAQNQEMAGIEDFTNTIDKTINSIQNNYELLGTVLKTENGINYTADGAGNQIPVPVGFSPIKTKDQGTKDTGFVIKNNTDGNEFVWIPVAGMEYIYDRYDFKKQNGNYSDYSEILPTDEQTSVRTFGGYYIGRYETGVKNGTLVIQDNQKVWNNITRANAVAKANGLYNKGEHNVQSKLCSSYAWDTALKFIETQNSNYPTNSTGGNYTIATGEKGQIQRTGYHAVNNIYDMGGNVWEWTTEDYNNIDAPCVIRGGLYSSSPIADPAADRFSAREEHADGNVSFRITLFM